MIEIRYMKWYCTEKNHLIVPMFKHGIIMVFHLKKIVSSWMFLKKALPNIKNSWRMEPITRRSGGLPFTECIQAEAQLSVWDVLIWSPELSRRLDSIASMAPFNLIILWMGGKITNQQLLLRVPSHRQTLLIMRCDWSHSNWIQIKFFIPHSLTTCPKKGRQTKTKAGHEPTPP